MTQCNQCLTLFDPNDNYMCPSCYPTSHWPKVACIHEPDDDHESNQLTCKHCKKQIRVVYEVCE